MFATRQNRSQYAFHNQKPMTAKRIIAIGECMVELTGEAGNWRMGYGGDTLNTCIYLARLLRPGVRISYMTRLGGDIFGSRMLQSWAGEGVGLDLTEVVADRTTGLYAISTDDKGERSFTYWRERAPARDLLNKPLAEDQRQAILAADLLFFSGITLAILSDAGRSQLIDLAECAKSAGRMVGFDTNYRPRLWAARSDAKDWMTKALRSSTVALASTDELAVLFGVADHAAQLRFLGDLVAEAVLRDGAGPVALRVAGHSKKVNFPPVARPLDTTGAGDSFNAAYLAARLNGTDPAKAAKLGCKLAAVVIAHPGAIIPASAMPEPEQGESVR